MSTESIEARQAFEKAHNARVRGRRRGVPEERLPSEAEIERLRQVLHALEAPTHAKAGTSKAQAQVIGYDSPSLDSLATKVYGRGKG